MAKKQTNEATATQLSAAEIAALSPLAERFSQNPVMIDDSAAMVVAANLRHLAVSKIGTQMLEHDAKFSVLASDSDYDEEYWPDEDSWMAHYRPYIVSNGVLQIPVMGNLMNDLSFQFGKYATGYTYIKMAVQRGMADANVKAIAFVIDSPGGEVAGNFELADYIHSLRGQKPMKAFTSGAYSAAYSLASATDSITVTRSGGVGSIGIVSMHMSVEGMMKNRGVKVTYIYAGKHKIDGNPHSDLSEQARTRFQARVDKLYGVFTSTVARNRNMDDKDVRGTEALTYDADEALTNQLADAKGSLEEGLVAFAEETANQGVLHMAITPEEAQAHATEVANAAAAATTAGHAAGSQEAMDRINAVIALPEFEGRESTALKLAATDMDLETMASVLGTVTKTAATTPVPETDAKGKNHFEEQMEANGGTTTVASGAQTDEDGLDGGDPEAQATADLLSDLGAS